MLVPLYTVGENGTRIQVDAGHETRWPACGWVLVHCNDQLASDIYTQWNILLDGRQVQDIATQVNDRLHVGRTVFLLDQAGADDQRCPTDANRH